MKVEYNENERRPVKKTRGRKAKRNRITAAVLAIVVVLGITVALMLTVLFNVTQIKVVGSSIYSQEDIVYASGIMNGDNLFRLTTEEIEKRIEQSLPYVKNAVIEKSFPDTVGIEITPAEEALVLDTPSGKFICDSDYKVLRLVNDNTDGLLRIVGVQSTEFTPGKTVDFTEKQQRDTLADLIGMCVEKGLQVTYIDIENLIDINFVIDGRLYIKLGSYTDMSGKLSHLEAMLQSLDQTATASISLDSWSVDNKQAVLKYEDISGLIK